MQAQITLTQQYNAQGKENNSAYLTKYDFENMKYSGNQIISTLSK